MKRLYFLIVAVLFLVGGGAQAQLVDFPGTKILDSGFAPVGACKPAPSTFHFTIYLNANFNPRHAVRDKVSAGVQMVSLTPSCGTATKGTKQKNQREITWKLTGCNPVASQSLHVTLATAQSPNQNSSPLFLPRFCRSFPLNDGAVLVNSRGRALSKLSTPLRVASCLMEGTAGCVDADRDGESIDCGDCNDTDPLVYPDAAEICGDNVDNDCDAQVDEGC